MARVLGRSRRTISRELRRNISTSDGASYRPQLAHWYARRRLKHSRRNARFSAANWATVDARLALDWSPEQIVGWCTRFDLLAISHESIYRHVWADQRAGGTLHGHLRCAYTPFRKR